mgnify:CR=1 FL=1
MIQICQKDKEKVLKNIDSCRGPCYNNINFFLENIGMKRMRKC